MASGKKPDVLVRITPVYVFTRFQLVNNLYSGSSVAYAGSSRVATVVTSITRLKRKSRRANAYAAKIATTTVRMVVPSDSIVEFTSDWRSWLPSVPRFVCDVPRSCP